MSFSFDTKCEICELKSKKQCCRFSQFYGMVLLAQHIGRDMLKITTENVLVVNMLSDFAKEFLGAYFAVDETVNSYTLTLFGNVLQSLYDSMYLDVNGKIDLSVSGAITENSCCTEAFLRGAFLVAGYIANPENSYHFEISTAYYTLAKSLRDFMTRAGFPAKLVVRNSNYVVYMKESESVEKFLYFVGAKKSGFDFAEAKIQKEMNNYTNRVNNSKIHNIEKTINKSVEQVKAIKNITEKIGLEYLDSDLAFAAKLRLENPDKSLNELIMICNSRYSRSALNRKLNKLMQISAELGADNG